MNNNESKLFVLPKEIETGNIEYKRNIVFFNKKSKKTRKINIKKKQKYFNQIKWRLFEGLKCNGTEKAIYYIGIDDDGSVAGLSIDKHDESINNFKTILKLNKKKDIIITNQEIFHTQKGIYSKIELSKIYSSKKTTNIILLGDHNSGKSTFLGCISNNIFDNGDGSAKSFVARHSHEYNQGHTSSITHQLIGFNNDEFVSSDNDWENIYDISDTVSYMIDTPGYQKYMKKKFIALTSNSPEISLIFIDATNIDDEIDNAIHDYRICKAFGIKSIFVVTKIDLVKQNESKILKRLSKIVEKQFLFKENIICISNITKYNYDILSKIILSKISNNNVNSQKNKNHDNNINFLVFDKFNVSGGVGTVYMGILKSGQIKTNDNVLIGPAIDDHNSVHFVNCNINSIHLHKSEKKYLNKGDIGCITISDIKTKIKKYPVIISPKSLQFIRNYITMKVYNHGHIDMININSSTILITGNSLYDSKIVKINITSSHSIITLTFSNNNQSFYIYPDNSILIVDNHIFYGHIID